MTEYCSFRIPVLCVCIFWAVRRLRRFATFIAFAQKNEIFALLSLHACHVVYPFLLLLERMSPHYIFHFKIFSLLTPNSNHSRIEKDSFLVKTLKSEHEFQHFSNEISSLTCVGCGTLRRLEIKMSRKWQRRGTRSRGSESRENDWTEVNCFLQISIAFSWKLLLLAIIEPKINLSIHLNTKVWIPHSNWGSDEFYECWKRDLVKRDSRGAARDTIRMKGYNGAQINN